MRGALFCLILGSAAAAQPQPDEQLTAVERKIDETAKTGAELDRQARAITDEVTRLQDASVDSARIAQDNEARLTDLEARIGMLAEQESRQQAALQTRQDHERQVLTGLLRLTENPPAAVLLSPGSPLDLARGAMLLGAVVPRIEAEARDIAVSLGQLRQTRARIAQERAEMAEHQAALDTERQRLDALMAQKRALEGETRERAQAAQQTLAALTAQAGDLKDLIQRVERDRERKLDEERRRVADAKAKAEREEAERAAAEAKRLAETATRDKPSPGPGMAPAAPIPAVAHDTPAPGRTLRELQPGRSALLMPAAGEISKRFGDPEGFSTSKGLTITTRVGARVVAPFDGRIMFAGPFKGYGQILIIDHGGGYHSLLAGMEQLDASVGQEVIAGEPLGTMRTDGTPSLYLELRRQGQPINPLPWLAARDGKVSG
jgi:septal ring factor EnvC (AmiA/AmiB activator)